MPPDSPAPNSANDDQAMLVTWLSTHDAPCPACKYNLRHLTEPRCPECGRPLSLSVAVIEPYLRSWIALIVLLWLNAGPGVILGILFLIALFQPGRIGPFPATIVLLLIFYLGSIPLAIAALLSRGAFVRIAQPTQRLIVTILAVVTLSALITLIWQLLH